MQTNLGIAISSVAVVRAPREVRDLRSFVRFAHLLTQVILRIKLAQRSAKSLVLLR